MPFQTLRSFISKRQRAFLGWSVACLTCIGLGVGLLYDALTTIQFESPHPLKYNVDPAVLNWLLGVAERAYVRAQFTYWDLFGLRPIERITWAYYAKWVGGAGLLAGARPLWRWARRQYRSVSDLGALAGMGVGAGALVLAAGGLYMSWVSMRAAGVRPADRALASRYNQAGYDALEVLATGARDSTAGGPSDENVVLSPLSLGTALHMTAEGARGQTAAELREALHLPKGSNRSVASGPSQILRRLRHPEPTYALRRLLGRASAIDTRLANAGWFDAAPTKAMKSAGLLDFEIREDYRRTVEEDFRAEVFLRDFSSGLTQEVNRWASEKTAGKIRKLLDEAPRKGAVLANAVYFFGEWSAPFDPENTERRPFVVPRGAKTADTTQVPTMQRTGKYPYMEQEVKGSERPLQGARLPYGETGQLAMYVFVPPDLGRFVRRLGPERWAELTSGMDSTEIELRLPKFTLESRVDLIPALRELGVKKAFSPGADFRGVLSVAASTDSLGKRLGERPGQFFLNRFRQSVYLEVNERGTEAAAVTVGTFALSAPPKMAANRPFYFAIAERETGAILFHGAIRNPKGSA